MRVSMSKSLLPSRPMQAFKNVSSALRCLFRLFTTSVPAGEGKFHGVVIYKHDVPGLTSGALSMYESSESTEYSGEKSAWPAETSRYFTRVSSSVRMVRSRMSGVASRES